MQELYVYVDDSGVFHKSEKCGWFVYAGYVFVGEERNSAQRKYASLSKAIAKQLKRNDEIKAYKLDKQHKRRLVNVLSKHHSMSVSVELCRIRESIFAKTESICRFKDYAIKRILKKCLQQMIIEGNVDPLSDTVIHLYVDEQATATDGVYSLPSTIYEEFRNGILNFDYGKFREPIFKGALKVEVEYCDSKNNYLIQACDILANRVWASHRIGSEKLIPNNGHSHLTLP